MATAAAMTIALRIKSALFNKGLKQAGKRVGAFRKQISRLAAPIGAVGLGFFMRSAVREAASFTRQMGLVNTMLNRTTGKFMPSFTKAIKRLSIQFGQSKEVLAKGLFDILSAGVDASKALGFLTVATKAAIGGGTDTATAVSGMITVLNAYSLEAERATEVSDLLFAIVRDGVITFEEIAENIAKLAPLAKAAGVTLNEMGAIIATVVKIEKPERAMTAIRAALSTTAKAGVTLIQRVRELKGASLKTIMDAGFTRRSAAGVAILTGNIDVLNTELANMADKAGKAGEAFSKMSKTADQKLKIIEQRWNEIKEAVGAFVIETAVGLAASAQEYKIALLSMVSVKAATGAAALATALERQAEAIAAVASARERLNRAQLENVVARQTAAGIQEEITAIKELVRAEQQLISATPDISRRRIRSEARALKAHERQIRLLDRELKGLKAVEKAVAEVNRQEALLAFIWKPVNTIAKSFDRLTMSVSQAKKSVFSFVGTWLAKGKKLVQEQKKWAEVSRGIFDEVKTGAEIFTARLKLLFDLVKRGTRAGGISWETYGRAVSQAIGDRDIGKMALAAGEFRVINPDLINIAGLGGGGRDPILKQDAERNEILRDTLRVLKNPNQDTGVPR